MAKNKIELLLTGTCYDGKIKWNNVDELKRFCIHYDGEDVVVRINKTTDITKKEKLFAYLFGPLLDTLQTGFAHAGYGDLSKKDCYIIMKQRYGSKPWYNPLSKKEETILVDFSDDKTTQDELLEFINNIVIFLERDLEVEAPDSEAYKVQMRLGSTKRIIKTNLEEY
jgi:hypothetical protein